MRSPVAAILVYAFLLSCSGNKGEQTGAPDYSLESFRVESAGGCHHDSIPCASFEIIYPVFTNLSTEVSSRLVQLLERGIAYDNPESEGMSMEEMGNQFIQDFEKFNKEFPENHAGWYFKTSFDVQLASDTLISVSANSEFFTGGAHGGYSVYYVNIDPRTGGEIRLESYLKAGYTEVLHLEGEKSFRQARELNETDNLAEHGFQFPEGQFRLNSNYGFREEGIVFFYNSYEIASHAAGPTEILIPWEVLANWRK